MREIGYTRAAIRDMRKIPAAMRDQIRAKITQYAKDPASLANNVAALHGRMGKRLRVGDYRILFAETETEVEILRVRPRGQAYRP